MKHAIMSAVVALIGLSTLNTFAQDQKKYSTKHEFWYQNAEMENDFLKVEVKDAVSQKELLKFRIKFTNKTNEYVFVNPSKMRLNVNGQSYPFKEKPFIIEPFSYKTRVLDLAGQTNYHQETFSITFDGLEKASTKGVAFELDDFVLPPSQNSMSSGPFSLNLKYHNQETDATNARFVVKYTGSKIAIVDPSKVGVKIESGRMFANAFSKVNPVLIMPGEEDGFSVMVRIPANVVDMQFATLFVSFGEAFQEVSKTSFTFDMAEFKLDLNKTKM
jgi:hypothetical protein